MISKDFKIKRYISTKCIGYNQDFTVTYFESYVEMKNGEFKTIYNSRYINSGGLSIQDAISDQKPIVKHLTNK
jgi:hypothetical protein